MEGWQDCINLTHRSWCLCLGDDPNQWSLLGWQVPGWHSLDQLETEILFSSSSAPSIPGAEVGAGCYDTVLFL